MDSLSGLKDKISSLGDRFRRGGGDAAADRPAGGVSRRSKPPKQSVIAVDFGASALRAIQEHDGTLVAVGASPVAGRVDPADTFARLEMQAAELRDWIKQGLFKGKRVVGVLPTEGLVAKHLQVESIPGLDVSVAALTTAAEQLGVTPDRIVHRCLEVAPIRTGGVARTEVVSFCSPRTLVERLVGSLRRVGLDLVGLHAAPMSLAEAFSDVTSDSSLVVELGARQTSAMVLDDGRISVIRFAPQGMDAVDHAIAGGLDVSVDRARTAREQHGGLKASEISERLEASASGGLVEIALAPGVAPLPAASAAAVSTTGPKVLRADQAVSEVIEEMCEELMVAVRYHRGVFPSKRVSRVVFTGGGARCLDLCRRIAERLGVAAQLGDPLAGADRAAGVEAVGVDLSEPTPAFSAAFGARACPVDL